MSFLPSTNRAGVLAGIYLVNAVVAPLTVFYGVSDFRSCLTSNSDICFRSGRLPTSQVALSVPLLSQSLAARFR